MKTVYVCTYVEKRSEIDDFEKGCQPETAVCVMAQRENITAESLTELIQKIGDQYGLKIDYAFLNPGRFSFNRLETVNGNKPTGAQRKRWEQGKSTLYLADYDFSIEKRTVCDVPPVEFDALGIQVEHFE